MAQSVHFSSQASTARLNTARAGIAQSIGYVGPEKAPVGADINSEALFRGIVNDLVGELRTQQRTSSHQSQNATIRRSYSQSTACRAVSSVISFTCC
jgi:hypothetical protein